MSYESAIHALADPTRREIFERLRRGEAPVGQLADGLQVTRPAVSQHLRVLEEAGLVRARREGTRRIYSIEVRGLRELRRYLDGLWDEVIDAFQGEVARTAPPAAAMAAPSRRRRAARTPKRRGKP